MLLFWVSIGLFLIVEGLVLTIVALVIRGKIKVVGKPWYTDADMIQCFYMVSMFLVAVCTVLFLLKVVALGLPTLLVFLALIIVSFGLAIYGLVLANRKKHQAAMKKRVSEL